MQEPAPVMLKVFPETKQTPLVPVKVTGSPELEDAVNEIGDAP